MGLEITALDPNGADRIFHLYVCGDNPPVTVEPRLNGLFTKICSEEVVIDTEIHDIFCGGVPETEPNICALQVL